MFFDNIPFEIIYEIIVYLPNHDLFNFSLTSKENIKICEIVWKNRFYDFTKQEYLDIAFPKTQEDTDIIYMLQKKKNPIIDDLYWYRIYTNETRRTFVKVVLSSKMMRNIESENPLTIESVIDYIYKNKNILKHSKIPIIIGKIMEIIIMLSKFNDVKFIKNKKNFTKQLEDIKNYHKNIKIY